MTRIYGVHRSRALRNYWLAAELEIDVEEVPVIQAYRLVEAGTDPGLGESPLNSRSPEFLKVSKAGAIPVMDDDGLVLSESLAINHYLARKHGGPLAPVGLREEALMLQWALYGTSSIEPHALAILYAYGKGRQDSPQGRAEIAAAVEELRRPLAVLEAHLDAEVQMVGGRFTVADINMAEILRYAQPHPTLFADYPAISRWIEACQARPAFQAVWAKRNAEPA